MSKFIRLITRNGLVFVNPFYAPRSYQRPRQGDARNDFVRLGADMRQVGADLRRVANKELGRYAGQ